MFGNDDGTHVRVRGDLFAAAPGAAPAPSGTERVELPGAEAMRSAMLTELPRGDAAPAAALVATVVSLGARVDGAARVRASSVTTASQLATALPSLSAGELHAVPAVAAGGRWMAPLVTGLLASLEASGLDVRVLAFVAADAFRTPVDDGAVRRWMASNDAAEWAPAGRTGGHVAAITAMVHTSTAFSIEVTDPAVHGGPAATAAGNVHLQPADAVATALVGSTRMPGGLLLVGRNPTGIGRIAAMYGFLPTAWD